MEPVDMGFHAIGLIHKAMKRETHRNKSTSRARSLKLLAEVKQREASTATIQVKTINGIIYKRIKPDPE